MKRFIRQLWSEPIYTSENEEIMPIHGYQTTVYIIPYSYIDPCSNPIIWLFSFQINIPWRFYWNRRTEKRLSIFIIYDRQCIHISRRKWSVFILSLFLSFCLYYSCIQFFLVVFLTKIVIWIYFSEMWNDFSFYCMHMLKCAVEISSIDIARAWWKTTPTIIIMTLMMTKTTAATVIANSKPKNCIWSFWLWIMFVLCGVSFISLFSLFRPAFYVLAESWENEQTWILTITFTDYVYKPTCLALAQPMNDFNRKTQSSLCFCWTIFVYIVMLYAYMHDSSILNWIEFQFWI